MNQDLEGLLKAWETFLEAGLSGADAKRLHSSYLSRLGETCSRMGASEELIHRLVKQAYPRWKRANQTKFPTLPPQA